MSITARPSATITAADGLIFTHAPSGLGATLSLGVRETESDVYFSAPATTGITETTLGGGLSNYSGTRTAPADVTKSYEFVWLISGTEKATEDLHVSTSAPVGGFTGNLTDLASVREFLQKEGTSTGQDAVIESLIVRASEEMMAYTRREYAPTSTALLRQFRYEGQGHCDFKRWDLRSATLIQTRKIVADATWTTLVADDDYELDPLEAPDGVYTGMYLAVSQVPLIVSVTGDWGWPAVPARVQHWCNVTVSEWLRKDVAAFSTTFDVSEDRLDRPEALPSAVRRALSADRRRRALIA